MIFSKNISVLKLAHTQKMSEFIEKTKKGVFTQFSGEAIAWAESSYNQRNRQTREVVRNVPVSLGYFHDFERKIMNLIVIIPELGGEYKLIHKDIFGLLPRIQIEKNGVKSKDLSLSGILRIYTRNLLVPEKNVIDYFTGNPFASVQINLV